MKKKLGIIAIVCLLLQASGAAALDVAIVAEDNKILQQIMQNFQSHFRGSMETFTFDPKSGEATAKKVAAASPKVIVALGSGAAKQMAETAPDKPVLYAGVLNPRKAGLDGPNVAGVPMTMPVRRQWAVALKGFRARRIGVLVSADNADMRAEAEDAGRDLNVKVKVGAVSGDGLAGALKTLEEEVDSIWIPLDPAVAQQMAFKAVVDFCLKKKLPLIVPAPSYVKQGGLISVSSNYSEMGKVLASIAKSVLEGSSPKTAAAKNAGEEETTVNLAVAREIGVAFPSEFLRTVTNKIE